MNKTRSMLVIIMSAAAVALAETPATPNPVPANSLPTPPAPGAAVEGTHAGAAGNPETMMRERMRRMLTGGDGEGMILRMLTSDSKLVQELGLSDTQVKQIKDAVSGSDQETKDLNTKLEQAAMRQVDLMKADTLDEEALMKAVQEAGDLRTQIAKIRVKQLIAAHKVLTPEQRTKLRDTMKQRMEQAQKRMTDGAAAGGFRDRAGRNRGPGQPGAGPGRGEASGATAPQPPAPPAAQ